MAEQRKIIPRELAWPVTVEHVDVARTLLWLVAEPAA